MKRLAHLLLAAGLLAACSSTPTVIPTRNLDRPTDMGFVCLAMVTDTAGQSVLSGQPMDVCHPRGAVDPTVVNDGQRSLGTFAFLPNAGRGELAVADLDRGRLLDLGPQSPGYGMLPISGGPEVLATSKDGCLVAMANRTSCDFTLVDPARLLASTFSGNSSTVSPATGQGEPSRHLLAQTATGRPLRTAVGEIAFLPSPAPVPACQASAIHRAVATFPGCDLVALLDLSYDAGTAKIASAYYVRSGGFEDAGAEPVCPEDCATPPGSGASPDLADGGVAGLDGAASHDGGASLAPPQAQPLYVQPLALLPDGSRVYVGGYHDSAITSFAITDAGLTAPERTELAESPGGVRRLRLNIDPFLATPGIRPDGTAGKVGFLDARGSFLYAFAADDSIRVLNLDGPAPVECDVNVLAPEDARRTAACLPVGTPGRRPLAQGPGIRIPTFSNPDTAPPLPRDIAFADFQPVAGSTNYHALSGQFGFVLASSGQIYVLNLAPNGEDGKGLVPNDTCLPDGTSKLPVVATHSFREARDVGQCARTPIAVSIAPQRQSTQTDQAFATTVNFSALEGPQLKSFSRDGGKTTSWFDFPDPDTVISRSWDVVWEGTLPDTTRISGIVRNASEAAGALQDAGANFCASGVRSGDIVMISGCTRNSDCQPDDKFSCQISVSGARGMCLPIESSASEALIARCRRFMGSRMRYEVARAEPTRLTLRLKLDEVPKTTLNPCTQDADCWPDTEHGSLSGGNPDGGGRQPFRCIEVRPQERRCVQSCSSPGTDNGDNECRSGHVCETVPWTSPVPLNLCVQAPPVDEGCFPQPMTAYSVRAGQGFVVYGSSMPSPHNGRVVEGTCAYDEAANPALANRIPLSAPRCPDSFLAPAAPDANTGSTAQAAFVQQLAASAGSNPCLYSGAYRDSEATDSSPGEIRAFFQNPQIRFVLANLDTYAGDLLRVHFELQYGFVPMTVQIPSSEVLLTLGTRILTGPTKTPESPVRRSTGTQAYPYLYVVDQGRTALTSGSRGQVLRINARAGSNEIATFDTAMSGSTPFQLQ